MTKTARVYKIEMLIRSRGCISFAALRDELEVSPATLKRDLEYLRDQLGAPIEYDRDRNGYRFSAGLRGSERHELPGLWFNERELYALLMAHQLLGDVAADGAVGRHLAPLLERIHRMLGADAGGHARALLERVKIVSPAKRPVPARFFELFGDALGRRRRVRMAYLSRRRGDVGERDVSPQRLVHYRGTWYVDAWCHGRERLLRFALDAVQRAELLDDAAKVMALDAVEAEMDRGYGIYAGAEPHWATLRFAPHAAAWVSGEQWHRDQRGRWLDDGSWQLDVPYTDPTELAMDVLRHAGDVAVTADTGTLAALVRERTRQAWQLQQAQGAPRRSDSPVV